MRTELVIDALQAAAATRGGRLDGAIFHRRDDDSGVAQRRPVADQPCRVGR
jgi:hypothetical protein